MAQPIEWENISPALPDEVGAVELSQVVELGSKHYVERFTDYLVPADDQVYTKPPKVHVPEGSWDKVCEGLLRLGVCQVIPESQVHHVQGKPLLNGLFGVSKHEFCQGYEVRRLIMNLIPLNRICKDISGDVATLPSWANMSALQLSPHEDLVVSSEDVRCFFYIYSGYPHLGVLFLPSTRRFLPGSAMAMMKSTTYVARSCPWGSKIRCHWLNRCTGWWYGEA